MNIQAWHPGPGMAAMVAHSQAEAGPYIWWLCHPPPVGPCVFHLQPSLPCGIQSTKRKELCPYPLRSLTWRRTAFLPLRSLGRGRVAT